MSGSTSSVFEKYRNAHVVILGDKLIRQILRHGFSTPVAKGCPSPTQQRWTDVDEAKVAAWARSFQVDEETFAYGCRCGLYHIAYRQPSGRG